MSESIQSLPSEETSFTTETPFKWGEKTPRGAKAVFARIIKEST